MLPVLYVQVSNKNISRTESRRKGFLKLNCLVQGVLLAKIVWFKRGFLILQIPLIWNYCGHFLLLLLPESEDDALTLRRFVAGPASLGARRCENVIPVPPTKGLSVQLLGSTSRCIIMFSSVEIIIILLIPAWNVLKKFPFSRSLHLFYFIFLLFSPFFLSLRS